MLLKYCKKCFTNNFQPNIKFKNGTCIPCNIFEKQKITTSNEILVNLIKKKKKKDSNYDCIIGVSGGKDSLKQANYIKNKLKLRPLLVCLTYPPETVTETGVLNLNNLIEQGFDIIISAPNPQIWKDLIKTSFIKFGNFRVPSELALFSSVPQMAIKYEIPIIIWGENPAVTLGESKTLAKEVWDGNSLRNLNTLKGTKINWIEKKYNKNQILPYYYPSKKEFKKNKLQIFFMGALWKDWSIINNAKYAIANGLSIRKENPMEHGDLFGYQSLDEDFVHVNQMIKYYKYGYGRTTEYVNEMIRLNNITREQGKHLISKYDGKCSKKYIYSFCNYINISPKFFWKKIFSLTNKDLFRIKNNKIEAKFSVK